MAIEIQQVLTRRRKGKYIHLPARLHKYHTNWVPPIWMDERNYYNPRKNKSFLYCDTILFLAILDGKISGRIMGIINHRYNESHNEKHARFSWLECTEDPEIVKALLMAVEHWAKELGMDKIVGPMGFSDKDPQGMLIEGFGERMVIATNCNYDWMPAIIEDNGYEKDVDLVVYKLDIPDRLPEIYEKIAERVLSRNHLHVREFKKKKELKPSIRPVLQLMNDTFEEIYGFDRMTPNEMDELATRYIPLLDPRFIKVVENADRKPVAFIIGMPDLSEGIIQSRGYLFPVGILKIIRSGKRTKQLNLLLGAIHKNYRNYGLDALMACRMIESANEAGMEFIDSHLELEENRRVRAEMERLGGKVYKRYRIFGKNLGTEP